MTDPKSDRAALDRLANALAEVSESGKDEAIRKALNTYTLTDLLIALAYRIAALEVDSDEVQKRLARMEHVVHRMERRL